MLGRKLFSASRSKLKPFKDAHLWNGHEVAPVGWRHKARARASEVSLDCANQKRQAVEVTRQPEIKEMDEVEPNVSKQFNGSDDT